MAADVQAKQGTWVSADLAIKLFSQNIPFLSKAKHISKIAMFFKFKDYDIFCKYKEGKQVDINLVKIIKYNVLLKVITQISTTKNSVHHFGLEKTVKEETQSTILVYHTWYRI